MSNTKPGYSTASCCDSTVSLCGFKLALVALPYGEGPQKIMPLGLQNISAYLKKHCAGVNVRIFDYSESTVSDLQQIYELIEWRPLLVGFSVYSSNVIAAKLWADAVSARLPLSFIFCGGPHISLAAESFIRYTKGVYKLALVGEGEYSTLQLVKGFEKYLAESAKLRQGQSDSNPDTFMDFEVIPNAVWLNEHGECLTSRKYKNQLPACEWENPLLDYHTAHLQSLYYTDRRDGLRRKAIAFTSSRGCPLTCSFCAIVAADKTGPKWRAAEASTLLKWLEQAALTYDFQHVYMMDANFFVRKDRVIEFSNGFFRLFKGKVTWSSSSTVGYLLKIQDTLPILVSQGLRLVELGIESGSQSQLDYMNKKITVEKNIAAIRTLHENGIAVGLDFIMFYHDQKPREILENLLFILRSGLTDHESLDHYFNIMMLYPCTPVREDLERRLGHVLPLESLPDSRAFIEDHEVSIIYSSFIDGFAKQYLARLEEAISRNISRVRSSDDMCLRAYYSLLNVYLRHLPFKVLWSLTRNPRLATKGLVSAEYLKLLSLSLDDKSEATPKPRHYSAVTTGSGGRRGELIAKTR